MGLDIRVYKKTSFGEEEINVWLHKTIGYSFWQVALEFTEEYIDIDNILLTSSDLKNMLKVKRKDFPVEIDYDVFVTMRKEIRTILEKCEKDTVLRFWYND